MWEADIGILDAWKADLASARGRGAYFGRYTITSTHLAVLIVICAITVLRSLYVFANYKDPDTEVP